MPKPVKQTPVDPVRDYLARIGRKGGQVSGARRMTNLTPKQRSAIARKGALTRWTKKAEETS